ncbi:SH3 domain-containing protein [uncultured Aquimarina sp.]|uniref:SH3 domain-containing protein n=1 Tax=uncultured Aquimarina sp. TaxID=575652 RepID=UPI0026373154|nr:SH3 domain-containing protein [uncultured Aquimarina sp.]
MKSIFTFILLLVMTSSTFAQIKSLDRYLMSTAKLELRTGPGANFDIIGEIPQGTQVYVISSGYGDWSTVQYKNGNGFVLTKLLAEDNSIAEAERAAKAAEAKKRAAKAAAEKAIRDAEAAKIAAAEAARKAIAEAERLQRLAEQEATAAAAAAAAANKNKSVAEQRRLAELAETQKALEEANKRTLGSTETAYTPIESKTSSNGSNASSSNRAAAAPSKAVRENKFSSWEKKTYKSGATPKSFNFKGKFEYKLDNYLKIEVGKNTDVVVKLVKMGKTAKDDETIRIVYINSNQTQYIRNIPEGEYYCVIAYGKDWREDPNAPKGRGQGQFTKNPLYEKGQDILDYNTIKTPEGMNVPSYSLSLDLLPNGTLYGDNAEDQDNIDASAFGKY